MKRKHSRQTEANERGGHTESHREGDVLLIRRTGEGNRKHVTVVVNVVHRHGATSRLRRKTRNVY